MADDIVYGWHFLDNKGRAYGGHLPPAVGEWEAPIEDPEPCVRGYHGSPTILAALRYAGGSILGRCEFRGVIWHADGTKWAARERRCIVRVDASRLLRYAAAHFAEDAMRRTRWTDPRSWAATQAARDFADGKISATAMATASATAMDTAWAAAWAAVRATAWASAWAAAWASAGDTAGATAWTAAGDAAWASARDAAWASAGDTAMDTVRAAQSLWLDAAALDLDVEPMWSPEPAGGEG